MSEVCKIFNILVQDRLGVRKRLFEANITDEADLSNGLDHCWSDTHQTYMN